MDIQAVHLLYIVVVVILGLLVGPLVARFAARRIQKQPVAFNIEAERRLVGGILRSPHLYPSVAQLEADMFVDVEAGQAWGLIKDHVKDANAGEDVVADDEKDLAVKGELIPSDLTEHVLAQSESAKTLVLEADPELKTLLGDGAEILYGYKDRVTYSGSSVFHPGQEGEPALVRHYKEPGRGNQVAAGLLLGGMLATVPTFATMWSSTTPGLVLAALALVALVGMGVIIALVDNDTLYIDLPVFYIGTGAAWALSILAALVEGDPVRILAGLVVVAIAVFFRVVNFLYGLVRKREGMGFGDSMIIVATCGVPAILSGDPMLGLFAMLGGCIMGILHWVLLRIFGNVTRETPFAFGPGLVVGWVIAFPLMMLLGAYSQVIG